MSDFNIAMNLIEQLEKTEISYCKVGENSKKLVVVFASNMHRGFERKTSLMQLKYERSDFDVLYLRNQFKWYLGGLNGIGKNINHTLAFLKKEFSKYDEVLCTGCSAGGYASILFGSLLEVDSVIVEGAQISLDYVIQEIPTNRKKMKICRNRLTSRKHECKKTWKKYSQLNYILNESVEYYVYYEGDDSLKLKSKREIVLHGDYHFNLIKDFPSVTKLNSKSDALLKIIEKVKM